MNCKATNFFGLVNWFIPILMICASFSIHAQDIPSLTLEGKNFERKYKDIDALDTYNKILVIQPENINALVRITAISGWLARRFGNEGNLPERNKWLVKCRDFAEKAINADSLNTDAIWARTEAYRQWAQTEEKKDEATEYLRQWKSMAENGLRIDSTDAKLSHLLGSWHIEVLTLDAFRKATSKVIFGGLKDGNIEIAIKLMEFCRDKEPYYCANFLDLAKAYNYKHDYANAIQTLERLIKLPSRTSEDLIIKAEGKEFLQKLQ